MFLTSIQYGAYKSALNVKSPETFFIILHMKRTLPIQFMALALAMTGFFCPPRSSAFIGTIYTVSVSGVVVSGSTSMDGVPVIPGTSVESVTCTLDPANFFSVYDGNTWVGAFGDAISDDVFQTGSQTTGFIGTSSANVAMYPSSDSITIEQELSSPTGGSSYPAIVDVVFFFAPGVIQEPCSWDQLADLSDAQGAEISFYDSSNENGAIASYGIVPEPAFGPLLFGGVFALGFLKKKITRFAS